MDDVRAKLMEMLASGKGGGDLRGLLAEQASSNPQIAALLQVMAQREAAAGASAEDDRAPERDADRRSDLRRRERADRLRSRLEDMQSELEELRERNELCAAALGACFVCWGTDDGCAECAGRGRTGWKTPDPELFRRMVLPAVRRQRAQVGAEGDARKEAVRR